MQTSVSILGSSGSIGEQTLTIIRDNPDRYRVACIAANKNWQSIVAQAKEFNPSLIAVADFETAEKVKRELPSNSHIVAGPNAALEAARFSDCEIVVAGIVGFAGLESVLEAIKHDKSIALANKESLIAGGALLQDALNSSKAKIVTVDSEHNAIYQCLDGNRGKRVVDKIALTASGGPFLNRPLETFENILPEEAVRHPRWEMGAKISVDSATLANKGLEVIEAAYLFNLSGRSIEILVHPESVVHGTVSFGDGSTHAVLYPPDMKVPIFHAMEMLRENGNGAVVSNKSVAKIDLTKTGSLTFLPVDNKRFPIVQYCYEALSIGKSAPLTLNGANEIAVMSFLKGKCLFTQIPQVISAVTNDTEIREINDLSDIIAIDQEARNIADTWIKKYGRSPSL